MIACSANCAGFHGVVIRHAFSPADRYYLFRPCVMLSGMHKKKNPAAVQLGRRGGQARAKTLTKAERRAIATKAVNARWDRWRQAKKNGA